MVLRRKEDRHIGLKDFSRSMPALPCFGMNTTLQDSGMYLRATEALNSLHSWGSRISNPRCKQTGLTPSPPGALVRALWDSTSKAFLGHTMGQTKLEFLGFRDTAVIVCKLLDMKGSVFGMDLTDPCKQRCTTGIWVCWSCLHLASRHTWNPKVTP
ncbi:hypothetical protein J6590_035331 [Homalodisca vitripennis]|nr:hypothetical protein J6590_035331 [Homalodisca vitripennis]